MARRERTTGLPRPRPRREAKAPSRFGEREQRLALIGGAAALIVVILGLLGWRWYDQTFLQPNKTILTVGEEKYSLKYYADRLFLAAQQQSGTGTNVSILEQTLLTELETEAVTIILAREKGVTVSEEEITAEIASQLGVPVGGAGSSFDTLYRQRLRAVKMSDSAYRRYTEAQVYRNKLADLYEQEVGDKGEMFALRTVVAATKEEAEAILARARSGEDLGTLAQTLSTDLASRQKDGLMEAEPTRLLPENVRKAVEGKSAGDELFGPVEVAGNWWVFRIQTKDSEGQYSETQKAQLADLVLEDALAAKRPQVKIERDIESSDYKWAEEHAGD